MVRCPRCGYENAASSKYCDNCAYLLADPDGGKIDNKKRTGWSIGIAKKIVIVFGIIVIAMLLFSFINNNSQPDSQSSLNVITDDGSQRHISSYPFTAVVEYDGSWFGRMGDPNYLVDKSATGRDSLLLDCASWERVYIEAQKEDSGDGPLTIKLYQNGKVVAENTTTNTNGKVTLMYNY